MAKKRVRTIEYDLQIPQWPSDFNVSVALLSDIHLGVAMTAKKLDRIVDEVNALDCDVVAVLGDMVDGKKQHLADPMEAWATSLAKLRGRIATAGVAGNHDYKCGIAMVRAAFQHAAIPMLNNHAVRLEKDGRAFWLAGLDSQWGAPAAHGEVRRGHHDLPKTLDAIKDDAPAILLAHEPDIFDHLPERFPITFSGHTHGGQIKLPLLGRPIVRAFKKRFHADKIYGHKVSDCGKRQMVITSGVGCSGIGLRVGVPPEIVRVNLRGSAA